VRQWQGLRLERLHQSHQARQVSLPAVVFCGVCKLTTDSDISACHTCTSLRYFPALPCYIKLSSECLRLQIREAVLAVIYRFLTHVVTGTCRPSTRATAAWSSSTSMARWRQETRWCCPLATQVRTFLYFPHVSFCD